MGVVSLRIGQDLANEVHRTLHFEGVSLFFLLYHQGDADHLCGGRNIEQKRFPISQRDQDQGLRQELLDLLKCLLGLGRPFKIVGLLQEPIEVRDKAAEHSKAPYNSLYPLYVLNRAHPHDGQDLLWVGFDAMLGDDKTQQHIPWDPENILLKVEFDAICSEFCEGLL